MGKVPSASRADTAVKLVLVFFISLLSFSVGTYVGKQVSESEARQAALEADYNGEHVGAPADEHTAQNEEAMSDSATAPITDEDAASLAEEFVKNERKTASAEETEHAEELVHGQVKEAGHSETAAAPTAPTNKATDKDSGYTHHSKMKANNRAEPEVSSAANRVSHDLAPAADPAKVAPAPTTLPTVATTAIGKYTVQVASYATEEEAKNYATKLTTKGYSAFYVPAVISNKTWFRVSVGLFADQKSATNYRTELLATQVVSSAIVQKIVK